MRNFKSYKESINENLDDDKYWKFNDTIKAMFNDYQNLLDSIKKAKGGINNLQGHRQLLDNKIINDAFNTLSNTFERDIIRAKKSLVKAKESIERLRDEVA